MRRCQLSPFWVLSVRLVEDPEIEPEHTTENIQYLISSAHLWSGNASGSPRKSYYEGHLEYYRKVENIMFYTHQSGCCQVKSMMVTTLELDEGSYGL